MNWLVQRLSPPPLPVRKRLLQVGSFRGVVAERSAAFIPETVSGGGGGYLRQGTGHINPIWSRTVHTHWQEFWLRSADGQEEAVRLQGCEHVLLRPGHAVGVLRTNGTPAYVMNYSTGMLYSVAPLARLLPLHALPDGCAGVALTLLVAPIVGLVVGTAVAFGLSILVFIVIDEEAAKHPPSWLNPTTIWLPRIGVLLAMLVTATSLIRKARRTEAANDAMHTQGRAELDDACRRHLRVEPTI